MVGEISDAEKPAFLSAAIGLLMPIDWPEPFGLAMIEAMACGTPVIAFNRGSAPELVDEGLTGFIVDNESEAIAAVGQLGQLSRALVRTRFKQRFSARRMASDYVGIYRELTAERAIAPPARRPLRSQITHEYGSGQPTRAPRKQTTAQPAPSVGVSARQSISESMSGDLIAMAISVTSNAR